jgi:hypothetical protein
MSAFGIFLNLLYIIPSVKWGCEGSLCGLWIGEWHYHDALWHIAISRISFNSFPFAYPSASGYLLTSYNYLLGLILHLLELVRIDAIISYFYILPIISNIFFIFSLYRYLKLTKKTKSQSLWIAFYTYLVGSFSYLLIFYNRDFASYSILKGFPVATTLQPSFVLSNIQFFISLSIYFYLLTDMILGKIDKKTVLLHSFILTLSIGFKIYSSILTLYMITLGYLYWSYKNRSLKHVAYLFILSIISAIAYFIFYLPGDSYIKGIPFALAPLAIPHTLTESQNLFYDKEFTLGRYYMLGLGRLSPRLLLYELISGLIFVLINLGTRVVFPFYFIKNRFTLENLILSSTAVIGLVIPIFYIQKSGGWYNSIQFGYLSIYAAGILSALFVERITNQKSKLFSWLIIIIIVTFSIPNTILALKFVVKEKILISNSELSALSFLKDRPAGIVLSLPDGKNSSYVPAFSGKVGYLIDDEQAALMNFPTDDRRKRIDERNCKLLSEVDYIYLSNDKGYEFIKCEEAKKFKRIYNKNNILIFSRS